MRTLHAALVSGTFFLLSLTAVHATTINIVTTPGTQFNTQTGVRADTSTRGADLAGMQVTATYLNGDVEELVWQQFDPYTFGGVDSANMSIEMGSNPASMVLTARSMLTSLAFDTSTSLSTVLGGPPGAVAPIYYGASVFDISTAVEGAPSNTPTSLFGFPLSFDVGSEPDGDVTVTYSNAVSLGGNPAQGDLFAMMSIDFTQLTAGGFLGMTAFTSDLDTLAVRGDLQEIVPVGPMPSTVPLPAGLPLLLAALGGIAILRRRR